MIDIEPPHAAMETWRDIVIHLCVIIAGILIAIGLEQAAEAIHRHHEANHARALLRQEMDHNRQVLQQALFVFDLHESYLFNDLPVLERARTHTLLPNDKLVLWRPHPVFSDSAWTTIHENTDAGLLTYDELGRYGAIYGTQNRFNEIQKISDTNLMLAGTAFYRSSADRFDYARAAKVAPPDAGYGVHGIALARAALEDQAPTADKLKRLTPAQIDRLEQAIQEGIYYDDSEHSLSSSLQHAYSTFPQ